MGDETFEPLETANQFRQILSVDKLTVGFFLGAGCPCSVCLANPAGTATSPLIPDIRGLTQTVDAKLNASPDQGAAYKKLIAAMTEDGDPSPTIETLLNRIRALREVAGKSSVRGLTFDDLKSLDREISRQIKEAVTVSLPDAESGYVSLASFIAARRGPHVELFTTNYDLLIEQGLECREVLFFDGFVGAVRPFFDQQGIESDDIPTSWSRLWKLHGSINWRYHTESKTVVRSDKDADGDELMIHPSHMKYDESRRMPYFILIDRLKAFLKRRERPVAFFIVGYSFGDQHLNEAIIDSLKANPQAACFALQFGKLEEYPEGKKLALRVPNLTLFARDAAIMRRRHGMWVASPATDRAQLTHLFQPLEKVAATEADPDDAPQPFEFVAGDFKEFGEFLDGLAPHVPESPTS